MIKVMSKTTLPAWSITIVSLILAIVFGQPVPAFDDEQAGVGAVLLDAAVVALLLVSVLLLVAVEVRNPPMTRGARWSTWIMLGCLAVYAFRLSSALLQYGDLYITSTALLTLGGIAAAQILFALDVLWKHRPNKSPPPPPQ